MSGGSQNAPTPYQPPNQAGSAASFQQGAGQLASQGSALSGSVDPQLAAISQSVTNNPYYGQALTGAQQAASTATGAVAPQQLAGAAQDTGIANQAAGAAGPLAGAAVGAGLTGYNQTQSLLPSALQGLSVAPGVFNQAQAMIPGTTQPLINAANQVLQTGFDPQSALYNQQYGQQLDQQNAINAQNGVSGSPYAAGITGQAGQNFNIDWQNQQLNRQLSALGGASSADTAAAGNLATLQSTGVNDYNALTTGAVNNANSLINTGTGALNTGINTGVGALSGLGATAVGANNAASDLGTAALNTEAGAAQLPQDIYLQQQQADLAALGSQISGSNAAAAQTQMAVGDQGQYLNIGQTAAQGAINAAQVNNQAAQASAAGFGNLFGDILGMFSFSPGGSGGGSLLAA